MIRIGISQRIEYIPDYKEYRDCLDQRWTTILSGLGIIPIPLCNAINDVFAYLDEINISGVILSGGNDSVLRDNFERSCIQWCEQNNFPLLGVCRGMQLLNTYYNGSLDPIENHVGLEHQITALDITLGLPEKCTVNSFHKYAVNYANISSELEPLAIAEDDSIEALKHRGNNFYGIMWHPERNSTLKDFDVKLLKNIFVGA